MSAKPHAPKWRRLYGLAGLMIGLLFLEVKVRLTQTGHEAVELGLVFAGYGLIWSWVNGNRQALMQEPERRDWPEPQFPIGQRLGSWRSGLGFDAEHSANTPSQAFSNNGRHASEVDELAEGQQPLEHRAGKGE